MTLRQQLDKLNFFVLLRKKNLDIQNYGVKPNQSDSFWGKIQGKEQCVNLHIFFPISYIVDNEAFFRFTDFFSR